MFLIYIKCVYEGITCVHVMHTLFIHLHFWGGLFCLFACFIFGRREGGVIWTHLVHSLVICMSNLKLFLSVCHLSFGSHNITLLPSHCPICSFLISHPEEYGLLWPALEWSCSGCMTGQETRVSQCSCHWATLGVTKSLQLPPKWLIHELLLLLSIVRVLSGL